MRLAARYLDERDPNFSDSEEMAMPPPLSSSLGGGGGGGSRGGGGGGRTSYALHTDLESRLREYKQGERRWFFVFGFFFSLSLSRAETF